MLLVFKYELANRRPAMNAIVLGTIDYAVSTRCEDITRSGDITPTLPTFTKKEQLLIKALQKRAGKVCTPAMLASELYLNEGKKSLPTQKILDVLICKVRKKIRESGHPNRIATVWGTGIPDRRA